MESLKHFFHHFQKAENDLERLEPLYGGNPIIQANNHEALRLLRQSQKFYIPFSVDNLVHGKIIDDEIKGMINLPFGVIAILTETHINENDGRKTPTMAITLCTTKPHPQGKAFVLWSLVIETTLDAWVLMPPLPVEMLLPQNKPGFFMGVNKNQEKAVQIMPGNVTIEQIVHEIKDNSQTVMSLCVLLALQNTTIKQVQSEKFLNLKHMKKGIKSLYDYKVLVIDGEVWDSQHTTTRTGTEKRSHLRRGHIRRLSIGRHVWVRATMVHGKAPGFVDKDYIIGTPHHVAS